MFRACSKYLLLLQSLFIIYIKWESLILAEALMTFIGIRSGPVALFGFNFLIVLLISSVVASGNWKEVLFTPRSLILVKLGWSLYLLITSRTVDLSKFEFSGLPVQFGASYIVINLWSHY